MRKNLNRALSVLLAVALVVSCAVSGMILPASAEGTATAIAFNQSMKTLVVGETFRLTVAPDPSDADPIGALTWATENEAVVTVTDGLLTAVAAGTAKVTATSGDLKATCTVTVTENILSNGDFEEGKTGPWTGISGTKVTLEEAAGYNGSKCICFSTEAGGEVYLKNMSSVTLKPNSLYRVTFLSKGPRFRFGTNVTTGLSEYYGAIQIYSVASDDWQLTYTYFKTGANPTVDPAWGLFFRKDDASADPSYLDNVVICEVPDEADVLYGGDLEMLAMHQWSSIIKSDRATVVEDEKQAGNHCLALPANLGEKWFSDVRLEPGREYVLSFRSRGAKGALFIYNNGGAIPTGSGWKAIPESTEWVQQFYKFKTADTAAATLKDQRNYLVEFAKNVSQVSGSGTGVTYVDDVCIYATEKPVATALEINKTKTTLGVGTTATLTATPVPLKSVYAPIVWASNNEAVATVNNGEVTAVAEGKATITATSGELSVSCEVSVVGKATDFVLRNETVKISTPLGSKKFYDTLEPVATPFGSDLGTLTWKSSDESVATVDTNGKVTALAAGTAVITAECATLGVSRTCTVTVDPYGNRAIGGDFENDTDPATFTVIKNSFGAIGEDPDDETNKVLAMPSGGSSMSAQWYWAMPVEKNKSYRVTYAAKGTTVANWLQDTYVSSSAGWFTTNLSENKWTKVTVDFTTGNDINVNYIYGFANRSTKPLYIDDFQLFELPDATSIAFEQSAYTVFPEGTIDLKLTQTPEVSGTGTLTWTSSNPGVLSVDKFGKVTALANEGSTTITAANAAKGLSASCTVSIDEYANIVINGDFEGDAKYWRNSRMIQDGIGKDGSRGFLLSTAENGGKIDCYYNAKLTVQPATTYKVSFDCYGATDASYRMYGSNFGMGSVRGTAKAGEWQHVEKVFTSPINMKLQDTWDLAIVNDEDGINGYAVIDNISICMYNSGVEAESIKLTYDNITLAPGRTAAMAIKPTPGEGDINRSVWTTSDPDVATVEYGQVTAIGQGTATITATTRNGKTATCEVTVSGVPALVKNSTFENTVTPVWQTNGNAAIEDGVGNDKSHAAVIRSGGTVTQAVAGLKPKTTYQLFLRYRSTSGDGRVTVMNGATELLSTSTGNNTALTAKTFEFKTPENVEELTTLTLGLADGAAGPIYYDHVFIAEKASEVDLVVTDITWNGADDQIPTGTPLTFSVTFANQGEDPVLPDQSFKIDIFVDRERVDQLTFAGSLEAGGVNVAFGEATWNATAGSHTLWAKVNSELDILEKNDGNNTEQVSMFVTDEKLEIPELGGRAGYGKLVFNDEFDSIGTVDTTASGNAGYKWYVTRPYGATTLTVNDYKVENGIMTVCNEIPTFNYGLGSTDMKTHNGYSFNQGYLEYRVRIPRPRKNQSGETGVPAVWSLPTNKLYDELAEDGTTAWVEMDFLEYWGDDYYTITWHDQKTNADGSQHHHCSNRNAHLHGLGDGDWHIMSFVWQYNKVTSYVDGEKVQTLEYWEDDYDLTNVNYSAGLPENGVYTGLNTQMIALFLGGSKDNPMELDWIRVWQLGGELPEYEPLPDEEGEGEGEGYEIAAEDFQWNYATDDWGDDIYDVTVENYANIMAGKEIWEGVSDDSRAEIDELLAAYGQPSFEELLAKAEILTAGLEAEGMEFLYDCFVNDDGVVDVRVLNSNVDIIHASEDAWNALSEDEQALVNEWLVAASGMTFEEMLVASPETGDAYPLMAVAALVLAAALVVFTRKRRVLDK